MAQRLKISHPSVGEFAVSLGPAGVVVGRHGGSVDLELNWDRLVSRSHGRFWLQNGEIWYVDLDSGNGSWLAGKLLDDAVRLMSGDRILVGDTYLTVETRFNEDESVDTGDVNSDSIQTGEYAVLPAPNASSSGAKAVPPGPPTLDLSGVKELSEDLVVQDQDGAEQGFVRQHPRFVVSGLFEVTLKSGDVSRTLPLEDLSLGGLFVRTSNPPELQTEFTVFLEGDHVEVEARAQVVRIVTEEEGKRLGCPPGIGLQFEDLARDEELALEKYLRWIVGSVTDDLKFTRAESKLLKALQTAKNFLDLLDTNNLYLAVGLTPKASNTALQARIDELREVLRVEGLDPTPPQKARLVAASRQLERISKLFSSPERRLVYDFRNGHERVLERIEESRGKGPPISVLREVWSREFPDQVRIAQNLSRRAFRARHNQDFIEALIAGRQALELDPFYEDLRNAVAAWQTMA